jgi:putative glutamine amidotransferase
MAGATYDGGPPLIGITTSAEAARWGDWVREAAVLPVAYQRAVERVRAVPILLPPSVRATVPVLVERLDGLIISGGGDLEPSLYHEEPHEETGPPQAQRDRFELTLLRAAIDADLPFLAIGRGMQALNVVREGNLIQHLPDVVGGHTHQPGPGRFGKHAVQISVTSVVGKALGHHAEVVTGHHQAVKRPGKGLSAVAWADDQVIEAIELQGHRFGVGVQWHPEESDDPRLIEALVTEARD